MLNVSLFNHCQNQRGQSQIKENICLEEFNLLFIFYIADYCLVPVYVEESIGVIGALDLPKNDLGIFLLEVLFEFFVDHVPSFIPSC
jgi:hypothetical protein